MASRLQDVIARGLAADRPLATDVAPGTLYFSTDTNVLERSDGATWESYSAVSATAPIHATTHEDAGTDELDVTTLGGYTGLTTDVLRGDGTFAALPIAAVVRRQVLLAIDGGTAVITTGLKGYVSLPVDGTWKKWRILSTDGLSGSITFDIWKAAYSAYPPTVANTITAADKPLITSAIKNEGTALTGWTTAFTAGDILGFNVDTVTTLKKVSLTLEFE